MELAALPARVDARGEVVQEPRVEVAPDVPGIELGRVDTGEDRPDAGGDDLPGKFWSTREAAAAAMASAILSS